MRVLVIGGNGVIGSKLVKVLLSNHEVFFTFNSNEHKIDGAPSFKLDITEAGHTVELLEKIKPEVTIHTSAITDVDLCETNHKIADMVNIDGTKNVVEASKKIGSKVVFISTSAVFDGNKNIYFEDDETNPTYYYAYTKVVGENMTKNSGLPFLILRTDQPYCWTEQWQKENSVTRILNRLEKGDVIKEPIDWYNRPTLVDNFVDLTIKLVERKEIGVYHIVGSDFVNRYQLGLKVAEIFSKDKRFVTPIRSGELNLPTKRVNVNLSSKKLQEKIGVVPFGIEEGLKFMRDNNPLLTK